MEISKINNSPNFRAKIIIGDKRIEKFIKSSFMANSRNTFDTLDKFSEINPDAIVSINIKNLKNRDYLVAKNGVTGATEVKLLEKSDVLTLKDRTAFIDLIKKVMNKQKFWNKSVEDSTHFDATALDTRIEHDVFNLENKTL